MLFTIDAQYVHFYLLIERDPERRLRR